MFCHLEKLKIRLEGELPGLDLQFGDADVGHLTRSLPGLRHLELCVYSDTAPDEYPLTIQSAVAALGGCEDLGHIGLWVDARIAQIPEKPARPHHRLRTMRFCNVAGSTKCSPTNGSDQVAAFLSQISLTAVVGGTMCQDGGYKQCDLWAVVSALLPVFEKVRREERSQQPLLA